MKMTVDEITTVVRNRISDRGDLFEKWAAVEMHYRGDYVIPFNTDQQPTLPPLTPLLIAEMVDNMALRAGSVLPYCNTPQVQAGPQGEKRATRRRQLMLHTWDESKLKIQQRRWFRHMAGYASGVYVVQADYNAECARIETRSPMVTLPEPKSVEDLTPVCDAAFVSRQSGGWLRAMYPDIAAERGGPITAFYPQELWDLVQWCDQEWNQLILMGPVNIGQHVNSVYMAGLRGIELSAWRNLTGMCPVVPTSKLTLEGIVSQVSNVLGQVEYGAKLQAMAILAHEKNIWPDTYARATEGRTPEIVGGQWQDGRTGNINLLKDVEEVGVLRQQPDGQIQTMIDRLERNSRVSTGLVPQFGGETYGALRTGRGIDALAGIAVDPRIQELHEQSEVALTRVNEIVLATYKAHWGPKTFTLYSGRPTDRKLYESVPDVDIETTRNVVEYGIPGADASQVTVILGQLLGMKAISRRTFMELHPFIGDPTAEAAAIDEEDLEEAVKQMIARGLVSQQIDPMFAAMIEQERKKEGVDIFEALRRAVDKMKQAQAAVPPPAPEGMGAAPAMMPGPMDGAPAGPMPQAQAAAAPQPTIGINRDQSGMIQLMKALSARPR